MILRFERNGYACPEQYGVYNDDTNELVAYIRLRHGNLTVECPDCGGDLIYEHRFENDYKGCFDDDQERYEYLEEVSKAIVEYYQVVEDTPIELLKREYEAKDAMLSNEEYELRLKKWGDFVKKLLRY